MPYLGERVWNKGTTETKRRIVAALKLKDNDCFTYPGHGGSKESADRCIDIWTGTSNKALGYRILGWVLPRMVELNIWYVVFDQRIYSRTYPQDILTADGKPKGRHYNAKSNDPSDLHTNHVHISCYTGEPKPEPNQPDEPTQPQFEWDGASFPGAERFAVGVNGGWVKLLGKMLVKAGWTEYQVGPGPEMGPADVAGVKWFQEKQGWTGSDADGVPGAETWKRLSAIYAGTTPPPPSTKRAEVIAGGVVDTPFKKPGPWQAGYHTGDDWNDPKQRAGATIHSAVTGKVVDVGATSWGSAYGNVVIVQDSTGDRTAHCHLKSYSVIPGDQVKAGQPIGIEGETGNVTGPHCHVERRHKPYGYYDHERPVYELLPLIRLKPSTHLKENHDQPQLHPERDRAGPAGRKIAGNTLGVATLALSVATLVDAAIPAIDYAYVTGPAAIIIGGLLGIFQLTVTSPNVPAESPGGGEFID